MALEFSLRTTQQFFTPEGEVKGTDIKGPVSVEATEKWPRIANLASMVI